MEPIFNRRELQIIVVLLNERIEELRISKTRDNNVYFELCAIKAKVDLWLM